MYSLVVMAALTTGGEAPDCFGHGGCYGGGGSCLGCYGCWGYGGCYGYGCSGSGYGGCWGCYGSYNYSSYGCHGCYGCSGCYGSCYGCWGCHGCWGYSGYAPMYGAPAVPDKVMPGATQGSGAASNRARLVVEVPADAKLTIDDQPTKATTPTRTFNTPALQSGQTYYYILKVEVAREGLTHTETRRVLLRAGEEVNAKFTEETIAAASKENAAAKR